ncbi:hypothetical protein HLB09_05800 [Pseudokineococcus marinus]|uniref:Uncharacterized protein n=1 Tax=Pseudokineococcus marinus TaxID=351215 RepID=A0A849BML4_9ACTN|nr:hypothetical protein [Pseudokineococcus marinus]
MWTVGGGIQAYRELGVFDRFYASVWRTADGIVDEQTRALVAQTRLWQFRRRSAIKRAVAREGWELLTGEEQAVGRDIDLRALGWTVVCAGGGITTAAAAATAVAG